MSGRLLPILAASLALVGLAQAAPAPFRKAPPLEQPEVQLRGWLSAEQVPLGEPAVIARQADYQAVARAWKIESPPKVDFRSHFLLLLVSTDSREARWEIDRGD